MAEQIVFLKKNFADLSNSNLTATASQGNDFTSLALNRKNSSAWMTTSSVDSDGTTFVLDFGDEYDVDEILLLKHNFKNFQVEYWDGAAYQSFSPAISETTNTDENTVYEVTQVTTQKVRLTVDGTMVADADKYLFQFIATKRLGQLNAWPIFKKPTLSRNRKKSTMLSGKMNIVEHVGLYKTDLQIKILSNSTDLTLIETLYSQYQGVLMWPSGGDESQFKSVREGFRIEDIYLIKLTDEHVPEWHKGLYKAGMVISLKIAEVID